MPSPESKMIPDDLNDAITYLESELQTELYEVDNSTPPETAPVGVQIAHALRANRLRADSKFIEMLHENRNFLSNIHKKS